MGNSHADGDSRRYTLEELGITSSSDVYGDEHLTIDLPPNDLFGTGQAQAVFNPTSRKWELSVTANTRFTQKIDASIKWKTSAPHDPEVRSRPVKWTKILPRTEHVDRFLNDIDWDSTSVGPLATWPTSLQAHLNIVLADSQAAVIYWGDDLVALYNAEFLNLVTSRLTKSQELLGMPFRRVWPELWSDFEPMLKQIAAQGAGLDTREITLYPVVDGIPEETIWQGSFLPVRDDVGNVQGFYNRAREITKSVVAERRTKVLSAISAKPHLTGVGVFQHLVSSLNVSERDFPLSFVYSAQEDLLTGKCRLKLERGEGLPEHGHPLVPEELQLYEGHTGFVPHFRKAKSSDNVLVLQRKDGTLPEELISGFRWKGYGEPPHSLAILPLSTSDRLIALLVVGLHPRRPYDKEYEGYLNTLLRSMSATVSSALDREEARNRADRLAKQLADSEKSIREIAEYGPVGIARLSPNGYLMWGNDQFYEITGHGRRSEDHYEKSFFDLIIEEDLQTYKEAYAELHQKHKAISVTLRIKKTWRPPRSPDTTEDEDVQNVSVLSAAYPMMEGNDLKAFALSVVDVSRYKWAEQVQTRVAASAKEAKRLQENFIDIVSHEMRNPLSAITQLSDAISSSLDDFDATEQTAKDARQILETNADNANTILLCAAHQKRIIDDVLTLSKLDSMLLSVTPVVVQPYEIIKGVLRMFEAEFIANDIQVHREQTADYRDSGVDWVTLDPSRLTQIFINLITNAVKFTKLENKREITIRVGASDTRPPGLAGVSWFPTNKKHKDLTRSLEWGEGKAVYICFEVIDTGRGLEQHEMTKLFGRFQQATEKTRKSQNVLHHIVGTVANVYQISSMAGLASVCLSLVSSRRLKAERLASLHNQEKGPLSHSTSKVAKQSHQSIQSTVWCNQIISQVHPDRRKRRPKIKETHSRMMGIPGRSILQYCSARTTSSIAKS